MRAVLDTNVYISGLVFGGKPRAGIEFVFSGGCRLVVSEPILNELSRKLSTKFGWRNSEIDLALRTIRDNATVVSPSEVVTDCADPDDNRILEAAQAGAANFTVSGDKKHLLRMKSFRGIAIISVDDFLTSLGSAVLER